MQEQAEAGHSLKLAGPKPGYELLFAEIYEQIRTRAWVPDQQILSERELCERYEVSRITVRHALEKAEQHGLLVRVPGRGTFVARPRIRQEMTHLQTFRSTLSEHALTPGQRVLDLSWQSANGPAADKLSVRVGSKLLCVDLLGLGDGKPMALYQSFLPSPYADHVEAALSGDRLDEVRSTYEIAATSTGIRTLHADQTFESLPLDAGLAQLLAAPPDSAAFRVSSVFRPADGPAIEWRVAVYPGDRYTFHTIRDITFDATRP